MWIAERRRRLVEADGFEANRVLVHAVLAQRARAFDASAQRERPRLRLLGREVEHLARGPRDAREPVLQQLQVGALPIREPLVREQPNDRVLHAADRVVDLVRDARSQRADGRKSRTLHQRALGALGLVDCGADRGFEVRGVVLHFLRHRIERRDERAQLGRVFEVWQPRLVVACADALGGCADALQRTTNCAHDHRIQHEAEQQRTSDCGCEQEPPRQLRRLDIETRNEPQVARNAILGADRGAESVGDLHETFAHARLLHAAQHLAQREPRRIAMNGAARVEVDEARQRRLAARHDHVIEVLADDRALHEHADLRLVVEPFCGVDIEQIRDQRCRKTATLLRLDPLLLRRKRGRLHCADHQQVQQQHDREDADGQRHEVSALG